MMRTLDSIAASEKYWKAVWRDAGNMLIQVMLLNEGQYKRMRKRNVGDIIREAGESAVSIQFEQITGEREDGTD